MTDLDVQVVAYGPVDQLRGCLAEAGALGPSTIIVVDHLGNVPDDVAAGVPGTQVVVRHDAANPGFGAGHNRALREAASPYVLVLNPDARVDPDGIAAGLELLAARPEVGAVQGAIVNNETGREERSQGRELGPVHLFGRALRLRQLLGLGPVRRLASRTSTLRDHVDRVPQEAIEVESLAATALLVRRDAMAEVGGFDESYFLYGEDLDLCRRLRRAGWVLIALPDQFATHVSGGSSPNSWQRELQWWQGTLQFAAKWWSTRAFLAAMVAGLGSVVTLSLRRPSSSGRAMQAMLVRPVRQRWRRDGGGSPAIR